MASAIPTLQTLMTVEEFRKLINTHFEKEISEGQLYDARDIERFNKNDKYATMFLQHGQFTSTFNEDRAFHVFTGCMSWRKRHNVFDISTNDFPAEYFERKVIYFKSHDKNNYPILRFDIRQFRKGHEDNEAVKRFITYMFEQQIREKTGDKIVMLFDMTDTGITNLDYDLVKFIISSMQIHYPSLLAYLLLYKMPFLLTAAWKLIRTWMSSDAEQYIKFVNNDTIKEYVPLDQLTPAMGGTASED